MVNADYLYDPTAAKKNINKNYFIDKKLGFEVIEHGTILPHKNVVIAGRGHFWLGGIVDSEGKYIKSSSLHGSVGGLYTPPKNQFNTVRKPSFISACSTKYGDTI